jgi:hypothetical protein
MRLSPDLGARGAKGRVGMGACGHARWFEPLLTELQFELWVGDAAEIRTKRVGKQKTDRHDARLILRLLIEDQLRDPFRIGDNPPVIVPSPENRRWYGFTTQANCQLLQVGRAENHAAAIKQTVISIEKTIGRTKRYLQLTSMMAAKQTANAHAVLRIRAKVSGGRPPSCHANIAAKRKSRPTENPAARNRSQYVRLNPCTLK